MRSVGQIADMPCADGLLSTREQTTQPTVGTTPVPDTICQVQVSPPRSLQLKRAGGREARRKCWRGSDRWGCCGRVAQDAEMTAHQPIGTDKELQLILTRQPFFS